MEERNLAFIRKATEGDAAYIQTHLPDTDDLTRQRAFVYGTVPVQKILLEAGVNVNATPCFEGNLPNFPAWGYLEPHYGVSAHATATALLRACVMGNNEQARFLIQQGADVNIAGQLDDEPDKDTWLSVLDGSFALWAAISKKNAPLMSMLLEAGADVNWPQNLSLPYNALYAALRTGDLFFAELLQQYTAKFTDSKSRALLSALAFLKHGDIPALKEILGAEDPMFIFFGESFLLFCLRRGYLKYAKLLLAAGTDPDAKDTLGQAPLTVALNNKSKESLEMLLAAGADTGIKDVFGRDLVQQALDKQAGEDIVDRLKNIIGKHH